MSGTAPIYTFDHYYRRTPCLYLSVAGGGPSWGSDDSTLKLDYDKWELWFTEISLIEVVVLLKLRMGFWRV